jgi:glycine betaine/proline transport system permease protein
LSTLARETGATDSWHFETGHAILLAALVLAALTAVLPPALMRPPAWMVLPFADWINWLFVFLKDDLGFIHVTRAISSLVEWLLDISANILYGKNRWPRFDQLPWSVIAITAFFIGYGLKGWRLGLLSGGTFVWIALFERALNPILNIAQSLPHFAYMIPVVIFVGVGPKAGAIVTIIFATPPMIRMTILGLKMVAPEVVESGKMCGATAWQLLRHVRTPTARTEILVGVNQVIMQCLAMVVLASFIGMPGLGQKLLQLLQSLKIGRSIEIGITIVLIAVTLDRCSKAWAEKQPVHHERGTPWWQQYRIALLWAALTAAAFALSAVWPLAYETPSRFAASSSSGS